MGELVLEGVPAKRSSYSLRKRKKAASNLRCHIFSHVQGKKVTSGMGENTSRAHFAEGKTTAHSIKNKIIVIGKRRGPGYFKEV